MSKLTFRHGIHPPENKEETSALPIRQFAFSPVIVMPLSQHIGKAAIPVVREGQEVKRGQLLAKADGYMSVPVHSPVSGRIIRLTLVHSISGKMVPGMYIESFPGSTQEIVEGDGIFYETSSAQQILQAIQSSGIVGLGGAAFPTHVKLKVPEGKSCEILIINGIECEPYLTTDHRVMLEQADDILVGIRFLKKATGAKRVIVGIEANKADAADHLNQVLGAEDDLTVELLPVKYPQGAEKTLITALLGLEVPSGGLPIDVGALVINVATTAEIGRLLPHGRGIQERVVTISGPGVVKKGNYQIQIGTPLRFVLEEVGIKGEISEVYMGGPMMGVAVSNLDISIVKGTSGILVFSKEDVFRPAKISPCIKCSACVDACPIFLNPSKLGILAKFEAYDLMADEHNLMDCFECGSCSYVCPSHIPLVQYFRTAKSIVRRKKARAVI